MEIKDIIPKIKDATQDQLIDIALDYLNSESRAKSQGTVAVNRSEVEVILQAIEGELSTRPEATLLGDHYHPVGSMNIRYERIREA